MAEADDIELVSNYFRDVDLVVDMVPEQPGVGKTPDLRLSNHEGQIVAYCEVKSPRDNWLKEQWEKAAAGQMSVGGARPDPIFNRVGRNLLKAARQFSEYSPSSGLPAIVVIVNHDTAASFSDLIETVTGKLLLPGTKLARTQPVDPAWIAPALAEIDAVGWINARRPTKPVWFFNRRSEALESRTSALLGVAIAVRL